jgi:hypothetical protein
MLERNGLIIVSGCPRSGTSVCMDIQREAHGEDAILGEKFPQENRKKAMRELLEKKEDETYAEHSVRKYLLNKQLEQEENQLTDDERKWRDMNPEGFWEMAFTVRGIIYTPMHKDVLNKVMNGEKKICKVVSQGLLWSDPMYISKIIYMIRHPRAVAKSQERLIRGFDVVDKKTGELKNMFDGIKIHTPEMYIAVTIQAANFFLNNPEIPVQFFHFEDLIEKPIEVIDKMSKFVGSGDYTKAYGIVQPKLNRSKHEDVHSNLWKDSIFVYDRFCKAATMINEGVDRKKVNILFKEIIEYFDNPRVMYNREKRHWRCFRAKQTVNESMCKSCISSYSCRQNFKKYSEKTEGYVAKHWSEEPCLFECGMDLDREEHLTIEESIKNNFWIDDAVKIITSSS